MRPQQQDSYFAPAGSHFANAHHFALNLNGSMVGVDEREQQALGINLAEGLQGDPILTNIFHHAHIEIQGNPLGIDGNAGYWDGHWNSGIFPFFG
jgi:hypothetical protein